MSSTACKLAQQPSQYHNKILRLPAVLTQTGLSRSTVYDLIAKDQFPRQIHLTTRCVGWRARDIDAWLDDRAV